MQGVLLVDKPLGWTSFDVVNYVRKQVAAAAGKKPKHIKVGHTGTLDPLATGLLVLLVGKEYTKRAGAMSKHDKTYEVTIELGATSTTGDNEGVKQVGGSRQPSEREVRAVCHSFVGTYMQTPPVYSAVKVNGQRAYDLARKGKEVALDPRPVTVYDMRDITYVYPHVHFVCDVSSGTYVRSLVEDIGCSLGTGAYMTELRRTRVGRFEVHNAVAVQHEDILTYLLEITADSPIDRVDVSVL